MASRSMEYQLKVDARQAQKALKDTAQDAEDTRTRAQKLSDALDELADDTTAEFGRMQAASAAMSASLGADFVEAQAKIGNTVDDIVLGLNRAGLSFEEIEADADRLAVTVRRLDDVRAASTRLGTGLDGVTHSGDQTRSVLANLSGNAAQDMGQLVGVTGSLGVGLGQVVEYATDGNIALSKLVGLAAPMAAIAVGLKGITDARQRAAEIKAFKKEEVDSYTESLKEADSVVGAIVEKLRTAGEIRATLGNMDLGDVTPQLAELGLTVEQFSQLVYGGKQKIFEYKDALDAAGVSSDDYAGVLYAAQQQSEFFADAQENAAAWAKVFGDNAATASDQVGGLMGRLGADDNVLATPFAKAYDALEQLASVMQSTPDDFTAVANATFNAEEAVRAFVEQTALIPDEKKTEILAALDQGDWDAVRVALDELTKPETKVISVVLRDATKNVGIGPDSKSLQKQIRDGTLPKISVGGGGGGGGGGSTTDPMAEYDAITKWFYERDIWSAKQYREYLNGRLADFAEYSDGWRAIQDELAGVEEDQLARKKAIAEGILKIQEDQLKAERDAMTARDRLKDNQFDFGEISIDDYRAYWKARLAVLDQSTDEAYQIRRKLLALDEQEKKAQDEINKKQEEHLKFLELIKATREAIQRGFEGMPNVQFFLDGRELVGSLKRYDSLNGDGWRA